MRATASQLGGRVEEEEAPDPMTLVVSVDGFPLEVTFLTGKDYEGWPRFRVSLVGWPTSTGLILRYNWLWRVPRSRFVWFDDPAWDDHFAVRAKEPDLVRLQLTEQRRVNIKAWFESYTRHSDGTIPVIKNGQFRSKFQRQVSDPAELVKQAQDLVELGKIITQ